MKTTTKQNQTVIMSLCNGATDIEKPITAIVEKVAHDAYKMTEVRKKPKKPKYDPLVKNKLGSLKLRNDGKLYFGAQKRIDLNEIDNIDAYCEQMYADMTEILGYIVSLKK